MSSESVGHVARSWVEVGSFHKRLVGRFMTFTASVRNIWIDLCMYSLTIKSAYCLFIYCLAKVVSSGSQYLALASRLTSK
jgi:hypothetical protein